MQKFLSTAEFRREAQAGRAAGAGVLIPSLSLQGVNAATRTATFTFSDESVDRSNDRINAAGWVLGDFRRNPIALWQHDSSSLPIGRAKNVRIEGSRLVGSIEFMQADISQFADRVFRAVAGGYLKAVSVGFLPLQWSWTRDPGRPLGIDFQKQALLEISVVTVPANAGALLVGASASRTPTPEERARACRRRTLAALRLHDGP